MMKNKTWLILTAVLMAFTVLFYYLYQSEKEKRIIAENKPVVHDIKYLPGDTITKTVKIDNPVEVVKLKVIKGDTVYLPSEVDTLAILADHYTKRTYTPTLFNNATQGRLSLCLSIEQNKLSKLDYEFAPPKIVYPDPVIKYITENTAKLYGGLGYYSEVVAMAELTTPKGISFEVGYGLSSGQFGGSVKLMLVDIPFLKN